MPQLTKASFQYAILFCLLASCSLRADQTVIVEPGGTISTLEQARTRVREIRKEQPDQPIEVLVKGGVYPLRETVVFGLKDSGTEAAPIVYKAAPGEKPVFTGGVPVTGWKKLAVDPNGVSKQASGKLWVAEIPKGFDDKSWRIRSLYDGDSLLKRARSGSFRYAKFEKENDFNRQGKKLTKLLEYEGEPVAPFDRTVHYKNDDIKDWPNPSDIELILKDRPWLANVISLDRIDAKNKIR